MFVYNFFVIPRSNSFFRNEYKERNSHKEWNQNETSIGLRIWYLWYNKFLRRVSFTVYYIYIYICRHSINMNGREATIGSKQISPRYLITIMTNFVYDSQKYDTGKNDSLKFVTLPSPCWYIYIHVYIHKYIFTYICIYS